MVTFCHSISVTSYWVRWRLKSPASRLFTPPFVQAQIKESITAPRHWPLCFHWVTSHGISIISSTGDDRVLQYSPRNIHTVLLCFALLWLCNRSHEVFIHIHQGCFAGTGAIVRLPQCQWSKPDGYGKISQCITTTKHSKAKTVCIFLGIYCRWRPYYPVTFL